ncbi:MAG TPA: hypothetical protein VH639_14260 [Bryobacteraceae bacterium]
MKRYAPLALALLLAACSKNIQNQEAVRSAVVDYLAARAPQTGLSMDSMTVEVANMSFEKDTARVTVSITPKGANGGGMQMTYNLDRKGDKWVVRPGATPHGMPAPAAPSGQALPPGHPAVGQQ